MVEFDLKDLFACNSRELEGREFKERVQHPPTPLPMLGRNDVQQLAAAWTCDGLAGTLLERWVEASA